MTSANDLLMGSGVKSAAFPTIGTEVTGTVATEPKVQQQTDFKTGAPKTFANGDPMQQIVVHLQTDQRDPAVDGDDGIRAIYIKSNMLKAVREAVVQAGAKGLEIGGTLTVTYSGDGPKSGQGTPKLYTAKYQRPTGQAANGLLMGGDGASAPTPVQQAAAAGYVTAPPGIDPAVWAQLGPEQRQQLAAASSTAGSRPPY